MRVSLNRRGFGGIVVVVVVVAERAGMGVVLVGVTRIGVSASGVEVVLRLRTDKIEGK